MYPLQLSIPSDEYSSRHGQLLSERPIRGSSKAPTALPCVRPPAMRENVRGHTREELESAASKVVLSGAATVCLEVD